MSGARRTVYVFAKAPRMGAAKTRLARDIGPVAAQRAYRAMTEGLLRRLSDPRWRLVVAGAPDREALKEARRAHGCRTGPWRGADGVEPQGGGDLGARQARFLAGPGPALIIGTDCPAVTRAHIGEAFARLGRRVCVLGPASDGGYWLIGFPGAAPPGLFSGVPWSSPETRRQLVARLALLGWRAEQLETLEDIDDGPSYRRWLIQARRAGP